MGTSLLSPFEMGKWAQIELLQTKESRKFEVIGTLGVSKCSIDAAAGFPKMNERGKDKQIATHRATGNKEAKQT